MNYELFDSMSREEAQDHLRGFIDVERVAVKAMEPAARAAGVAMDFSLASLPAFFRWIVPQAEIVRIPVPGTEPAWIREFHKDGFVEFPDESKYLILRSAYYLGECFVRAGNQLTWGIGDLDTVEKNMPVVTGFRFEIEMAPEMICENLFAGLLADGKPESVIDIMVSSWMEHMP